MNGACALLAQILMNKNIMNKYISFPIKLSGTSFADDGSQLETLVFATGYRSFNDCEIENYSYFYEQLNNYLSKELDHEDLFITSLNESNEWRSDMLQSEYDTSGSSLKFGAWFALEKPELFSEMLERFTTHYTEKFETSTFGDWEEMGMFQPLLLKAYETLTRDSYDNWLNGDRSNPGVVGLATKFFFGHSGLQFSYNQQSDVLSVDATQAELADYLGDLSDRGRYDEIADLSDQLSAQTEFDPSVLPSLDVAAEIIASEIQAVCIKQKEKKTAESKARQAERERLKVYKAEQAAKAEAVRREKLLAMKK